MGHGRYIANKAFKTKRYQRDVDQVLYLDMKDTENIGQLKNGQEMDENKPGMGQFYCLSCAKYFETQTALTTHLRTKVHKRRLKELKNRPYSKEEADFAAGTNVMKYLEAKKKQEERLADATVKQELESATEKLMRLRPDVREKVRATQLINKYKTPEDAVAALEADPSLARLPDGKVTLQEIMKDYDVEDEPAAPVGPMAN